MKLGIVGTGKMVCDLCTTLEAVGLQSLHIYGRNTAQAQALAQQYGMQAYASYEALLESEADTIYIALPNHLHAPFGMRALACGKHVILEKPMCANVQEFEQLRTLAKQRGCLLFEAMNLHELPAYQAIRAALPLLGNIKLVNLNFSQYSSRYPAFLQGEVLPAFDAQKAGGALMDINVYNLHFAVGLFGAPKSIHYAANLARGIDTSGVALLDYGDFKVSCMGAKDCSAPLISTIQGEEGSIVIERSVNVLTAFSQYDLAKHETSHTFEEGRHRLFYEFAAFARMIDADDAVAAEGRLAISAIVSQLMETARAQAGIVFPNDG